jgi:hypothetical protein
MLSIKKIAAAAAFTAATVGVSAGPAAAQTKQDGLVNVAIGDVTILEDVNIAAAVDAAVQACGIDVLDVNAVAAVLGTAGLVDQSSRSLVVCRQEDGDKVRFEQN